MWWLMAGLAAYVVSYFAVERAAEWFGYGYPTMVKIVGGGKVDYVPMEMSEYIAGPVSIAIMLSVWTGFCLVDHYK
jgi:hypothetical protein